MNDIRMDRLTWVEYQGRVREEQAPVILPVGATEQAIMVAAILPKRSLSPSSS